METEHGSIELNGTESVQYQKTNVCYCMLVLLVAIDRTRESPT
jgi:hypothetical protein